MHSKKTTFIIAEAGVNHNGSLNTARQLIASAKDCGADAVKFQTFRAEKLVTPDAQKSAYQKKALPQGETQLKMLKNLELSGEDFRELEAYCRQCNIIFMSSPFDEESVDLLDAMGMSMFKIPSGEITNLPFLGYVAAKGKSILLSTGMSTLGEVEMALEMINANGNPQVTLLHCVTEYPAPYEEVNLKAMLTLYEAFRVDVGYSDHTVGIEAAIAATALGAKVIEKHFTLDNDMEGPDHNASLNPQDFSLMVSAIRNVDHAMGDGIKRPAPCELINRKLVRKSIIVADTIEPGEVVSLRKLTVKRPGNGIPPMELLNLIGMKANKRIIKNTPLKWKDLS